MKKIPHYTGDSYEFFSTILSAKDPQCISSISSDLQEDIKKAFQDYIDNFSTSGLAALNALQLTGYASPEETIKKQLKTLYSYSDKNISFLRESILKNAKSRMCPYCTIVSRTDTMDHIIPQGSFPEFSVHPLNLIHCCSDCNRRKNNKWEEDGELYFLNPYLDDLSNLQFLYVELNVSPPNKIDAVFSIKNESNIPQNLFNRIRQHYSRLKLLKSFETNSPDVFSNINIDIITNPSSDDSIIKSTLISKANYYEENFGKNYWISVLYKACANNDSAFQILKSYHQAPCN